MPIPKFKWKVQPAPSGQYRSFDKRGWPLAESGDELIAALYCEDEYVPANVRVGDHGPITIAIRFGHREEGKGAWEWRYLRVKATSLEEAKDRVGDFFIRHPDHFFNFGDDRDL